jgi:gluconolactonase
MMRALPFIILLLLSLQACEDQDTSSAWMIDNDQLHEYFYTGGILDTLGSGYNWSEGPVWISSTQTLLFSDVPENKIYQWKEGKQPRVYLDPSGYTSEQSRGGEPGSNGLALDATMNLILCQHGDRRVARMATAVTRPESSFETLAENYMGKKFNSPNDLCIAKDGKIFFTDPPYGLPSTQAREIDFNGVYRVDPNGRVTLLIDSLSRPNGIALSPDEKTLYVANSDPEQASWYAYQLDNNKNIVSGGILADVTDMVPNHPGLPDGMKVHSTGIILGTGPGGVHIIAPDGSIMGRIHTGKPTSNCALDDQENFLYMTADDQLLRIAIKELVE